MKHVLLAFLWVGCGRVLVITQDGGTRVDACVDRLAADCRTTQGCVADFCTQCSCSPTFMGCRAASEAAASCPEVACAQPFCCGAATNCGFSFACQPPGKPRCDGVCDPSPSTCTFDSDCGAKMICEPGACSCDAQRSCIEGCSVTAPCAAGSACDATTQRCVASVCASPNDCPSTFNCVNRTCQRKTCSSDETCGFGFCVNGQCFDSYGECRIVAP